MAEVFDEWQLKIHSNLSEEAKEKARNDWVTMNKDIVHAGLNEASNYAQSQLREVIVGKMVANHRVPEPEEIIECAKRSPTCHDDEDKHWIFDFHWDVLLFKAVGKSHWGDNVRYTKAISTGINEVGKHHITVETEAILCCMFVTCMAKWKCIAECKRDGREVDRKEDRYNSIYVDSDAGQNKYGGWNKAGCTKFRSLCKVIQEARGQVHVADMENACLERLRLKHNLDEAGNKRKKGKKRRRVEEEESDDEGFEQLWATSLVEIYLFVPRYLTNLLGHSDLSTHFSSTNGATISCQLVVPLFIPPRYSPLLAPKINLIAEFITMATPLFGPTR